MDKKPNVYKTERECDFSWWAYLQLITAQFRQPINLSLLNISVRENNLLQKVTWVFRLCLTKRPNVGLTTEHKYSTQEKSYLLRCFLLSTCRLVSQCFFGWLVPTSARGGLSCSRSLLETKSQVKGVEIEAFIHRLASTNGEETPASAVSPETHGGMHTGRGHSYDSCLDKRRSGQWQFDPVRR